MKCKALAFQWSFSGRIGFRDLEKQLQTIADGGNGDMRRGPFEYAAVKRWLWLASDTDYLSGVVITEKPDEPGLRATRKEDCEIWQECSSQEDRLQFNAFVVFKHGDDGYSGLYSHHFRSWGLAQFQSWIKTVYSDERSTQAEAAKTPDDRHEIEKSEVRYSQVMSKGTEAELISALREVTAMEYRVVEPVDDMPHLTPLKDTVRWRSERLVFKKQERKSAAFVKKLVDAIQLLRKDKRCKHPGLHGLDSDGTQTLIKILNEPSIQDERDLADIRSEIAGKTIDDACKYLVAWLRTRHEDTLQ